MSVEPDYIFDHQDVVEALIRKQGLHEGLWRIVLELGLSAANVNSLKDGNTVLTPAGIVLVTRIGIVKTDEPSALAVDAAVVNPRESDVVTVRRRPGGRRATNSKRTKK